MDRTIAREKAIRLVGRMTLEERASQLRYDAPAIKRLELVGRRASWRGQGRNRDDFPPGHRFGSHV